MSNRNLSPADPISRIRFVRRLAAQGSGAVPLMAGVTEAPEPGAPAMLSKDLVGKATWDTSYRSCLHAAHCLGFAIEYNSSRKIKLGFP